MDTCHCKQLERSWAWSTKTGSREFVCHTQMWQCSGIKEWWQFFCWDLPQDCTINIQIIFKNVISRKYATAWIQSSVAPPPLSKQVFTLLAREPTKLSLPGYLFAALTSFCFQTSKLSVAVSILLSSSSVQDQGSEQHEEKQMVQQQFQETRKQIYQMAGTGCNHAYIYHMIDQLWASKGFTRQCASGWIWLMHSFAWHGPVTDMSKW